MITYTTLDSLFRDYESNSRQLRFKAQTKQEWIDWKSLLQSKLIELLGGFPRERCPLNSLVLESNREDGYRLEKIAFESEPGSHVPCYVLIPDDITQPYRPVIALHGHGTGGANYLLGNAWDETTQREDLEKIRTYNHDYARQLALHGFMVFVPVQRGLGERIEKQSGLVNWQGASQSSCRVLSFNALLMGKTLLGMRVWDVMRTIDYIRTRPETMTGGLGCVGLSGGGTTTLFTAALDERITALVVSGYINQFRTSIMAMHHCECNYVPNIVRYAEISDIASLVAPRPMLVESGTQDGIFPVEGTRSAYQDIQKVYALLGVPEALNLDIFSGGHQFSGGKTFSWFDRWLK